MEMNQVNMIKAMMLAAAMLLSSTAYALTDEEQVALSNAIDKGDVAYVKKLIKSGSLDVKQPAMGWTWLHIAATKNQPEIAKVLVENGAELNVQHRMTKATPLAQAAMSGSTEVVKYLLAQGADPNIKLRAGVSLLRVLRDQGMTDMAALLEQYGAVDDGCQEERCF